MAKKAIKTISKARNEQLKNLAQAIGDGAVDTTFTSKHKHLS